MIPNEHRSEIEAVATETISVFERVSQKARERLADLKPPTLGALANANAFTMEGALRTLDEVANQQKEACECLSREPAIARVVAEDESGTREVYYIARGAAQAPSIPGIKVASYHSETGRLAASGPGDWVELQLPSGAKGYEVVARALLHPREDREGWDSIDTVIEAGAFGPVTIDSLRRLLAALAIPAEEIDEVERLLKEEEEAEGILIGLRRKLITKMGLRDQPVLDRFQDDIFRLPLHMSLAVLGPPGTGKTTTLIRRLGQKTDFESLRPDETALLQRISSSSLEPHERSWLMFTPTDLLRQYVKEAFAREGIAAPDQRIRTWTTHRRELARNCFSILRAGTGRGTFIQRDDEPSIQSDAALDSTAWFEDFQQWQIENFWSQASEAARTIAESNNANISTLGARLETVVARIKGEPFALAVLELASVSAEVREAVSELRSRIEGELRLALNTQLHHNRQFIDDLAGFIDTFGDSADESEMDDETDADEDDEEGPQTRRGVAISAYKAALRSQARRSVSRTRTARGRTAEIITWIDNRGLPEDRRPIVGRDLLLLRALRAFSNPVRTFVHRIPQRYRSFRRLRRTEKKWYSEQQARRYVHPLEVDVILLAMLRATTALLAQARSFDDPAVSSLAVLISQFRNQILVDEATDFSPVQLACMAELCTPGVASFFVCGDFNQRVTNWGTRSEAELKWVRSDLDIRHITVAYRQTRQLYELACDLVSLSGGAMSEATLPEHVESEGVAPTLVLGMKNREELVTWLTERILEIEVALRPAPLPTIAVLVNDESDVQVVADHLNAALEPHNLKAVACLNGQMIGQENDVRVFNVEHIKGLEFEAVFFLDVDRLAAQLPDLFDKYLYVGATRAATYLGIACEGKLPKQLATLEDRFSSNWP